MLKIFGSDRYLINVLTTSPRPPEDTSTPAGDRTTAAALMETTGTGPVGAQSGGHGHHAETHILFTEEATLHDVIMGLTNAYIARLLLLEEGYSDRESMADQVMQSVSAKFLPNMHSKSVSASSNSGGHGSASNGGSVQQQAPPRRHLYQRADILARSKHISSIGKTLCCGSMTNYLLILFLAVFSEPFPGISVVQDFVDKVVTSNQWLVASGMLETRLARVTIT